MRQSITREQLQTLGVLWSLQITLHKSKHMASTTCFFTFDQTPEEPPAKDPTTEIVACPSHVKCSNHLLI